MHKIIPIPALNDNYIWAISAPNNNHVVIVDPGEAEPVIEYLHKQHLKLNAILLTHHHMDHIGGVEELLAFSKVPVYGPQSQDIPLVSDYAVEGNNINLPAIDLQLKVMAVPAHTLDHVVYYNDTVVFTGDTLFTGGCGRIFEGTVEQMLRALRRITALNPKTLVYCAHEYTINNLRFAAEVEPNNQDLLFRLARSVELRKINKPTVPSTIEEELATNPFLRTHVHEIIAAVEEHFAEKFPDQIELFAALRNWKNNF
jgi:hydroxyacylglutathione hydrolase